MEKKLIERVLKTVRNYSMLNAGDVVLVAVSGGPDSIFLLHTLNALKNKLKLRKLIICTLDHGLRDKESRDDSLFVKKIAGDLGLEFVHKKIDLIKKRSKDLSIEEAGRGERYKFFHKTAERTGANVIATGHTLDDQAETILMRLVKGASLKGMIGISPVRVEDGMRIIRPLIELEKAEIEKCLDGTGIAYRIDSTNIEPIYFRNVVRREIVPFLEKYNPRLKRVLFNLAEHLREDFDYITSEKLKLAKTILRDKDGSVEINLKDIVLQPKALQKEILRDALKRAGGIVKKLSFRHWKEIESLLVHKRKGNSVDLPGKIRAMRTSRLIVFHRI